EPLQPAAGVAARWRAHRRRDFAQAVVCRVRAAGRGHPGLPQLLPLDRGADGAAAVAAEQGASAGVLRRARRNARVHRVLVLRPGGGAGHRDDDGERAARRDHAPKLLTIASNSVAGGERQSPSWWAWSIKRGAFGPPWRVSPTRGWCAAAACTR